MGSGQMERIGECFGKELYFADSRFEEPGVYYWDGKENVRAWPPEQEGEGGLDVEALHAAVKSWEGGQSAVESMAQVSATLNNRGNNPNLPFPQPAAADGGVRERAEDLHVAICQAVALMNMEPMTTTGLLQAHDILRKAIS